VQIPALLLEEAAAGLTLTTDTLEKAHLVWWCIRMVYKCQIISR